MQRLPSVVPTHVRSLATAVSRAPLSALNVVARAKAEQITAEWKGTNASGENVKNYIGGKFVDSKSEQWIDLVDPVRPHRPSCQRTADGYFYSRRRPCFLVSQRRPPLSSSRLSKLLRRRLRPGVALPFSHDNDLPYSMPSHLSLSPGVIDLVITFLDFSLKYVKMQMLSRTASFLSKERPSPVCLPACNHISIHLPVPTQMRTVTSFGAFRWSRLPVTSQRL